MVKPPLRTKSFKEGSFARCCSLSRRCVDGIGYSAL